MQVNKDQPPTESEPNSIWKRPKGDLRVFGPDGKALKDIDYSHPKHHEELGNPHVHDWTWNGKNASRGKPRSPNLGELDDIAKIAVAIGGGYLAYRGIRMELSFIPGMWWSIPANLVTP